MKVLQLILHRVETDPRGKITGRGETSRDQTQESGSLNQETDLLVVIGDHNLDPEMDPEMVQVREEVLSLDREEIQVR